jgi:hypothetical protein
VATAAVRRHQAPLPGVLPHACRSCPRTASTPPSRRPLQEAQTRAKRSRPRPPCAARRLSSWRQGSEAAGSAAARRHRCSSSSSPRRRRTTSSRCRTSEHLSCSACAAAALQLPRAPQCRPKPAQGGHALLHGAARASPQRLRYTHTPMAPTSPPHPPPPSAPQVYSLGSDSDLVLPVSAPSSMQGDQQQGQQPERHQLVSAQAWVRHRPHCWPAECASPLPL